MLAFQPWVRVCTVNYLDSDNKGTLGCSRSKIERRVGGRHEKSDLGL